MKGFLSDPKKIESVTFNFDIMKIRDDADLNEDEYEPYKVIGWFKEMYGFYYFKRNVAANFNINNITVIFLDETENDINEFIFLTNEYAKYISDNYIEVRDQNEIAQDDSDFIKDFKKKLEVVRNRDAINKNIPDSENYKKRRKV